jgi:signal transduction histidine kinase
VDDVTAPNAQPDPDEPRLWGFIASWAFLGLVGVCGAVWLAATTDALLGPPLRWLLVVLLVVGCAALEVRLPLGERTLAFDLTEAGLVVALALLPPPGAVIAVTVAILAVNLLRRQEPQQAVYNVAITAVAATAAAGVSLLDGLAPLAVTELAGLLLLLGAVVAYWLVDTVAAALLLVRLDGTTFALTIRSIVRGTGASVALSGSLGLIAATLLAAAPLALPALLLPSWIAYRALREHVERIRDEVATRDRLERTVEGANDGIALLDADGTVELANPAMCRRLGVPRGRLIGSHLVDQVPNVASEDRDALADLLVALHPADPSGGVDLRLDDAVYTLVLTGLFDRLGARSGTVVLLFDVTEQRETESLRQEFVARVSHELRTPLTSIIGFISTLLERDGLLERDERRRFLHVAERQAARLDRLVSTLLWSARLERGRALPSPVDLPLVDAVEQTTEALHDVLPGHLDVDVGGMAVRADADHVQQVLGNLLTNAATYGQPPIAVRAWSDDGDEITIEVSDAGGGVATNFVPELFSPFSQASTGDRRTSKGLGLGLSISRGLLEMNGGGIEYVRAEGRTCFRVALPAADRGGADR